MTNSVSRGTPFSLPPRPMIALPQRPVADVDHPRPEDRERVDAERVAVVEVLSRNAPARLWAAPIAWTSPVRWRLKSSIGMTWL